MKMVTMVVSVRYNMSRTADKNLPRGLEGQVMQSTNFLWDRCEPLCRLVFWLTTDE